MLVVRGTVAQLDDSIDYYLFDGKYHRLYRRLISLLSACESALAELWHFCKFASAERADFISGFCSVLVPKVRNCTGFQQKMPRPVVAWYHRGAECRLRRRVIYVQYCYLQRKCLCLPGSAHLGGACCCTIARLM